MINFFYRYFYNISILMLLIFFLTACSSTRFIYTFIETFIQDEVNYFLDLDEEEEKLLNQQVSEMVAWHRISMLPSYSLYLNNIAYKLEENKYKATDINKVLNNGRLLIEETVTGLTPYVSKFLIQYQTIEAIEFIEKKMIMRRQEQLEKLSESEGKAYEDRLKRLILNFGRFLGDLNDAQVMLLEKHARVTLNDPKIRLQNRTLRQKVFIEFLKTQPTEVELTTYLNKLLLRGHMITNPDYKAFSQNSVERFRLLVVNMLEISSITQRERIISKLRDYADDFKSIAKN